MGNEAHDIDVWADESTLDDASYDRVMADRSWNRMHQQHGVIGYKEGKSEGREKGLQAGFDQGLKRGVALGVCVGRAGGIISTLQTYNTHKASPSEKLSGDISSKLEALKQEYDDLTVDKVFTARYVSEWDEENSVEVVALRERVDAFLKRVKEVAAALDISV
ncbi:hypothetical protein SmJEL517_g01704 [Synchytrium microbalum]|uniref:Protein YAE1 n=1 Tax=Synchytrium microbalum TaxID=1806994 RepID=A0A507C9V1_9FUNG|nr:uncharacterized protein SmJEL517_g01704 [Synchytrium microbalum]TPX35949.1 hypothetical protein SmJEL517_g01704 [Synchytrium microbalum]